MTPELIATLVERGISLLIAVFALLYGYRVIGKRPGDSFAVDQWHAKWGRMFRVCGWIMLVCFGLLLVVDLARVLGK